MLNYMPLVTFLKGRHFESNLSQKLKITYQLLKTRIVPTMYNEILNK